MRRMMFLLAFLSLLPLGVTGEIIQEPGKVGIFIENTETGQHTSRCVTVQEGDTGADLIFKTGLVNDYYEGDGLYFCTINGWGYCPADTWYYYGSLTGGCSGAGCCEYDYPSNGDVITFSWQGGAIVFLAAPVEQNGVGPDTFENICRSDDGPKLKYPEASVSSGDAETDTGVYCVNQPVTLSVLHGGLPVWTPTYSYELGDTHNGFLLRLLHRNGFWNFVSYLQTDENGDATFTPTAVGEYEVTIRKAGYVTQTRTFWVESC